jgi:hypothetical protein
MVKSVDVEIMADLHVLGTPEYENVSLILEKVI